MNLSQMLDLPKEIRSKYLAAIPTTRSYDLHCAEQNQIHFIRRVITRNGGVWRETYHHFGLTITATFRSTSGMRQATLQIIHHFNQDTRKNNDAAFSDYMLQDLMLDETFARTSSVPALSFEVVSSLGAFRPRHPIDRSWRI